MNEVELAYAKMHEAKESTKPTPQSIIAEAKKELGTQGDVDYSNDPEIKDLIENFDKADAINIIAILAKRLSA